MPELLCLRDYVDSAGKRRLFFRRGHELYAFAFAPEERGQMLRVISQHAAHPGLSLTWYDACVIGQHIRGTVGMQ